MQLVAESPQEFLRVAQIDLGLLVQHRREMRSLDNFQLRLGIAAVTLRPFRWD